MTQNSNQPPQGTSIPTGEFGLQPTEKRGHQHVAARPARTIANGHQLTTSQSGSGPATPPSPPAQGGSGKK